MKFTKIPADTFKNIQLNAGILVENFDPKTLEVGPILGATSGGNSFVAKPTFEDYGSDIDNCPKNTKELKKLKEWDVKMTGTFVTVTAASAATLIGAADVDSSDSTHIVPRNDVLDKDFKDMWWVGDYSDENSDENAGFCAIHVFETLSTGGISIKSADKGKGQFAYEFTGHYTMEEQEKVPFEIFIKEGERA